jgi:hypothetical protein
LTLLTLNFSEIYDSPIRPNTGYSSYRATKIQLKDIPLQPGTDSFIGSLDGSGVKDHVGLVDSQILDSKDSALIHTWIFTGFNWKSAGTDSPFIKVSFDP